jgi:hypothetical protein
MVAGSNIFVEQAGNGLGVSYLTALAGGAGTGSGGAGTGSGGAGTGTGGAGTGSGGSGTPQPVILPYRIVFFTMVQHLQIYLFPVLPIRRHLALVVQALLAHAELAEYSVDFFSMVQHIQIYLFQVAHLLKSTESMVPTLLDHIIVSRVKAFYITDQLSWT